jgi:glycosyltransferase involved in cell wall biosynthesis
LKYILDKHNVEKIDFMKIDIEGFEFRVLKKFFSEANMAPKFIITEFYIHNVKKVGGNTLDLLKSFNYMERFHTATSFIYEKKNKKVSLFIPSLRGGGAEKMFINLANEFVERGIDVDLVLAQKEGPYLKDVSDKVDIVDLKSRRVLFSLFPLIKYLRKEKPSVVLSTLNHANIIILIAKIFSFSKAKIIIRIPNYFSISAENKIKILAKIFYKRADKIIAISKGIKGDLISTLKIKENKIKVIYNPIFKKNIIQKSKEKNVHSWLKEKNIPIILGVGRLTEQKDFSTLIRAFYKLRKKREVKLIILGEGEKRKELEKLIKELKLENDVSMPGFVNNPYSYMKKADVFVLSSGWEGFGNVIVEAMTCGTSIVSTNCLSGPSEILSNGKYGKLVPVGNINKLTEAIEETLDNPIDKKILQKRAMDFSVGKITDEYLKVIFKHEKYERIFCGEVKKTK